MLLNCAECGFVVEIANLSRHLLTDCTKKDEYEECEQCKEAIKSLDMERHREEGCVPAGGQDCIRCPICHKDVKPATMEKWRSHVM